MEEESGIMPMKTYDELLAANGYTTDYYGKWHTPTFRAKVYQNPVTVAGKSKAVLKCCIAMFDEIDEGTAILKISHEVPVGKCIFVPNQKEIPTDHYLSLTGMAGKMLRGEIPFSKKIPLRTQ